VRGQYGDLVGLLLLKERVTLVTGAAGTIGREVSRALAAQGAFLAVTDVATGPLETLLGALEGEARQLWGQAVDASDLEAFSEFVEKASKVLGPPEVLVNVAGMFKVQDFVASGPADWCEMISANLTTTLVACRAVLPGMLEARRGVIVNFASTAGEYGSIRPSASYAAAKAGVIGFTKSLAREVSPRGVRVNAISPGPIDTPALQAATPEQRAVAAERTLLGRLGQPSDIAHGVVFLASDQSAFVTGTVLQVNGGALL
jgi:NAD(P)-dependent dehydrogenase (short-subunit alcohol dehydrogenase family)